MLPKVMTLNGARKCSFFIEEILLNLNKFQLTTFQEDDIFQYYVVIINSVRPSVFCSPTENINHINNYL